MLRQFASIREQLAHAAVDETRQVAGHILVNPVNIAMLQALQNAGHITSAIHDGRVLNFDDITSSATDPLEVQITLDPKSLPHYEGMADLVKIQNRTEPLHYIVYGVGEAWHNSSSENEQINLYRDVLRARKLIETVSDHLTGDKAFIVTSKKTVFWLSWQPEAMCSIACLSKLEAELAEGAVERDQRLALLRRALQQALGELPERARFTHFLSRADSIYEVYRRDYLLWIGETFSELEKTFEEKRLKFIGDINGVLSAIQSSILALPIAGLLVIDKFDAEKPLKNVALALGLTALAGFAWKLLTNQTLALNAISLAISSIQTDFENKHPQRKHEAAARLAGVVDQKDRVDKLVRTIRIAIICVMIVIWLSVFAACWYMMFKAKEGFSNVAPSPTAQTD